ncbi:MAG TPA: TIGR01777 family oxidoreductase [Candidatus Saccharimonadales bacterium]|jgi:uncharacterized protein (TIGR01777 family)|nr:TIGR01777 family oxidoreductase [Candidatus Saccharimonadales bacterium]
MRILVSGSRGFLGTAIVDSLTEQKHQVVRLVRPGTAAKNAGTDRAEEVTWDPVGGQFGAAAGDAADALIHLAGASIADERWSTARKNIIRSSRVDATRHLIRALSKLRSLPRIIVAASAVGYYGNRGDETLTEQSAPGNDFLAEACREWEAETARAAEFGARVVSLRFGIILAAHGGALQKMALPFKLGAGGRLGDGRQWMSWVTLAEVVNIVHFALANSQLAGPVNAITPNPVRNSEFTAVLAKTLHRPAIFPAPAFALRLALGEMADGLLLASQRVIPTKLTNASYRFQQADLAGALADVLHK